MKLYLAIANGETSANKLFIGKGEPTIDECTEAWEDIIVTNQKKTGSFGFDIFFSNYQSYAQIKADYIFVKAALCKLAGVVDRDLAASLTNMGFNISLESSEQYAKSIHAALRKSENLITKLNTKQKELDNFKKERQGEAVSFDEIVANLSAGLGFVVPDDITLARYNEYKKILQKKSPNKMIGNG